MNILERLKKGTSKLTITKLSGDIPAYVMAREQEIELMEFAKLGQQMQWVSMADRLPEVGQIVDVFRDNKRFIDMEVKSDNDGIYFDATIECHVFGIEEVTHWMSIPTAPNMDATVSILEIVEVVAVSECNFCGTDLGSGTAEWCNYECELQDINFTLTKENAELSGKIGELESQSVHIYNSGYHAGHNDTVEGCYTDVVGADMDTYHADVVKELNAELGIVVNCLLP